MIRVFILGTHLVSLVILATLCVTILIKLKKQKDVLIL